MNEADLKVGDEIEAAITFIDDKKNRIRLSVRRLSKLKEREALKEINKEDIKYWRRQILQYLIFEMKNYLPPTFFNAQQH